MADWILIFAMLLGLALLFNISRKMDQSVDLLREIAKSVRDAADGRR